MQLVPSEPKISRTNMKATRIGLVALGIFIGVAVSRFVPNQSPMSSRKTALAQTQDVAVRADNGCLQVTEGSIIKLKSESQPGKEATVCPNGHMIYLTGAGSKFKVVPPQNLPTGISNPQCYVSLESVEFPGKYLGKHGDVRGFAFLTQNSYTLGGQTVQAEAFQFVAGLSGTGVSLVDSSGRYFDQGNYYFRECGLNVDNPVWAVTPTSNIRASWTIDWVYDAKCLAIPLGTVIKLKSQSKPGMEMKICSNGEMMYLSGSGSEFKVVEPQNLPAGTPNEDCFVSLESIAQPGKYLGKHAGDYAFLTDPSYGLGGWTVVPQPFKFVAGLNGQGVSLQDVAGRFLEQGAFYFRECGMHVDNPIWKTSPQGNAEASWFIDYVNGCTCPGTA